METSRVLLVGSLPAFLVNSWKSYLSLNQREKMIFWAAWGNIVGSTYGYQANQARKLTRTSDHLEISFYKVNKEEIKSFETSWNSLSRLSQTFLGYEWCKMYKAIAWDYTPFSYVSMRMWGRRKYCDDFRDAQQMKLPVQFRDRFVTVVDDSVVRLIA